MVTVDPGKAVCEAKKVARPEKSRPWPPTLFRPLKLTVVAASILLFAHPSAAHDALKPGQSERQKLILEARAQLQAYMAQHFKQCPDGDSYASQESQASGLVIYQVRGLHFEVREDSNLMPLGDVDRANGFQWRGAFVVLAKMARMRVNGRWLDWEEGLFTAVPTWSGIDKRDGQWEIDEIFRGFQRGGYGAILSPLDCSLTRSGFH